jgi:hypothetical protein
MMGEPVEQGAEVRKGSHGLLYRGCLAVRAVINTTSELFRNCKTPSLLPDGDHAKAVSSSRSGPISRCGDEPSMG